MQNINTHSLGPDVSDWLANTKCPHVLHVFDHACNLINEHREILSIVTPRIGSGPFNLVVKEDICFSDYLTLESQISSSANPLHLGNLAIHLAGAIHWNARPNWGKLYAKRYDIPNKNMSFLAMTLSPLPITNSLVSALANGDLPSSLTAARKVAGLGSGLTPAGDDFIVGALYAAWIIHPYETASVLAREVANTAAPLTTSLSAAWLRSAGRGEAGILWHEFFDALISGDPIHIPITVNKILAVGATSGADALEGFSSTFMHFADMVRDG